MHSAQYDSAEAWKGKSGIVVGAANTGHDVADDMYEAGMDVTMVQRNRTCKWQTCLSVFSSPRAWLMSILELDVLPLEYIESRYMCRCNALF